MIVVTPEIDNSDAASTNTLVTEKVEKIPRHLPVLVYASFGISTLAFIFAIVDNVYNRWSNVPNGVVVPILAYIWILPHHCAVLLLKWLERHQTEAIFPFAPASRRVIAYCFISAGLWVGSSAVCAKNLYINTRSESESSCYKDITSSTGITCNFFTFYPDITEYGDSLASTVTSLMEMFIMISVTIICCMHHRRHNKDIQPTPPPAVPTPSESKVVSV